MSVNLAGLQASRPKKENKEKPLLPDPTGTLVPLVTKSIANKKAVEAYEGALTTAKQELSKAAFLHAIQFYHGRLATDTTFQIGTAEGKALVSLKNAYTLNVDNLEGVRSELGQHVGLISDSFQITISADEMPSFVRQLFVDELVKLARSLDEMAGTPEGQDGPVFMAITAKPISSIDRSFHEKRYALLNPEQNAALHRIMPCQIAVKFDY